MTPVIATIHLRPIEEISNGPRGHLPRQHFLPVGLEEEDFISVLPVQLIGNETISEVFLIQECFIVFFNKLPQERVCPEPDTC
jgi:hypothetical protein